MIKPGINLTIDKELLEKIELERGKKISTEKKNISRSAYICDLLQKGLKEAK